MIVDAHHHFWDPARSYYPWMTDEVAAIRRAFGPADLEPLLREEGVSGTVVVQARMDLAETCDLLETAASADFVLGVVGWVDLVDPDVAAILRSVAHPKLVGVRHQVHDEPDPGWLLRPDVQRGLRAVADASLAYDLLVRTRELPAALATARAHPELTLVVDHLAKPPLRGGDTGAWAEALASLADLPNVSCKLSGLVTEADWRAWQPGDLTPYLRRALGWFGAGRCLFGSDWPVCLLAASYREVLGLVRSALGPGERDAVLALTAASVYRLPGVEAGPRQT
jgi:L-fuconolactonase